MSRDRRRAEGLHEESNQGDSLRGFSPQFSLTREKAGDCDMYIGFLLAILSGVCYAVCYVPVRFINKFAWENIWFLQSLGKLVFLPILVGAWAIPSFAGLYREIDWRLNLVIVAVGLYSGVCLVLSGMALVRIGMTVTYAVANGISLLVGAFVPLIIQHREAMHGRLGEALLLGMVLAVLGVVYSAIAASRQDRESAYLDPDQQKGRSRTRTMVVGLLLAIASGILPSMNLTLAFAGVYMKVARAHGASEVFAPLALYIPGNLAAFFAMIFYFGFLWKKNGTLAQFRGPDMLRYGLWCLVITVISFAAAIFYGWAMPWMKTYGPIIGWPVCLTVQLVVSAVIEYFCGDWRGRALRTLSFALIVLTTSVALFAYATALIHPTI